MLLALTLTKISDRPVVRDLVSRHVASEAPTRTQHFERVPGAQPIDGVVGEDAVRQPLHADAEQTRPRRCADRVVSAHVVARNRRADCDVLARTVAVLLFQ